MVSIVLQMTVTALIAPGAPFSHPYESHCSIRPKNHDDLKMKTVISNILATPICHYNCDHLKAEADEQEGQAVSRHLSRDCLAINISKPTVPPFMATFGTWVCEGGLWRACWGNSSCWPIDMVSIVLQMTVTALIAPGAPFSHPYESHCSIRPKNHDDLKMKTVISNILATPICHYNCDHLKAEADEQEGQAVSRHLSRDCLAINISKD